MPPNQISVDPTYILEERSHAADGLSYDPELGVLTFQRDRELPDDDVLFVFPRSVAGHALSFEPEATAIPTASATDSDAANDSVTATDSTPDSTAASTAERPAELAEPDESAALAEQDEFAVLAGSAALAEPDEPAERPAESAERSAEPAGSITLPPLRMYQELMGELVFSPTDPAVDAEGAPRPKVKVKVAIRVRPTGGG